MVNPTSDNPRRSGWLFWHFCHVLSPVCQLFVPPALSLSVVGVHPGCCAEGERSSHPGGITENRQWQGGMCCGYCSEKYGPGYQEQGAHWWVLLKMDIKDDLGAITHPFIPHEFGHLKLSCSVMCLLSASFFFFLSLIAFSRSHSTAVCSCYSVSIYSKSRVVFKWCELE